MHQYHDNLPLRMFLAQKRRMSQLMITKNHMTMEKTNAVIGNQTQHPEVAPHSIIKMKHQKRRSDACHQCVQDADPQPHSRAKPSHLLHPCPKYISQKSFVTDVAIVLQQGEDSKAVPGK